jgi:predicted nucleotidyltransferase
MVQLGDINAWCRKVVREFRPDRIVLFGSFADGTPTDDSDVDMLIIMPLARGQRDVRMAAAIRQRVQAGFPMDVIVRSPRQITKRLAEGDGFIAGILRDGRLLYENKHA